MPRLQGPLGSRICDPSPVITEWRALNERFLMERSRAKVIDGRNGMLSNPVGRPRVLVSETRGIGIDVPRVEVRGRMEQGFVVSYSKREIGLRRTGGLDAFGQIKGIVKVATSIVPYMYARALGQVQRQGLLHTAVKRDR